MPSETLKHSVRRGVADSFAEESGQKCVLMAAAGVAMHSGVSPSASAVIQQLFQFFAHLMLTEVQLRVFQGGRQVEVVFERDPWGGLQAKRLQELREFASAHGCDVWEPKVTRDYYWISILDRSRLGAPWNDEPGGFRPATRLGANLQQIDPAAPQPPPCIIPRLQGRAASPALIEAPPFPSAPPTDTEPITPELAPPPLPVLPKTHRGRPAGTDKDDGKQPNVTIKMLERMSGRCDRAIRGDIRAGRLKKVPGKKVPILIPREEAERYVQMYAH